MATSIIADAWTFGSKDEVPFRLIKGEIPEGSRPQPALVTSGAR